MDLGANYCAAALPVLQSKNHRRWRWFYQWRVSAFQHSQNSQEKCNFRPLKIVVLKTPQLGYIVVLTGRVSVQSQASCLNRKLSTCGAVGVTLGKTSKP